MGKFTELAFTPAVKAVQSRMGSRQIYGRHERAPGEPGAPDELGDDEIEFIRARDSFYMASIGATGWPYIQHRGGAPGFVHALDSHTLAFADYRGNRQYISVGNLAGDDRVALIFVDYPHRARLKVLAHASIADAATLPALTRPGEPAAERAMILRVEGFDWNCPQHITPRYTVEEIQELVGNATDR